MDRSLFSYIWRHSKRDQLAIFCVVILSLPFYFMSLDLPKRIVNDAMMGGAFKDGRTTATFLDIRFTLPGMLGGGDVVLFPGLEVDQIGLLFGLSFLFLGYVFINGGFKYVINIAKGALGERMLRRLRFDLFAITLRFTPDTLRIVKPSETATIIKDEVEPIGGFIGDAFVQPLLLSSQAATAMVFIMMQSMPLGLLVLAIVGVQFTVIPRLRRIQLRLGKQRQLASRLLAGRIGEVVENMDAVHAHGTARWERAEIGERLYSLFDLRFRIYKWKFMVKFLNNFLSQLTPFFFYAIGGYLALKGQLDIGQLIAVIAAYRDLPPPLKELIDWDQQRLDVQIKYDQIIQQFMPDRLLPEEQAAADSGTVRLQGPIVFDRLRVSDHHGGMLVDDVSLTLPYPGSVALLNCESSIPRALAEVLAHKLLPTSGAITIAGHDFLHLPEDIAGRRIAYASEQPRLFPGTLRHNLLYGLYHKNSHTNDIDTAEPDRRIRIREALRTGNPLDTPEDDWIDDTSIGVLTDKETDQLLLTHLEQVGMADDIFLFGINGWVDTDRYPALGPLIVEARHQLCERLAQFGISNLVEPFDEQRYMRTASIGENLLFGASRDPAFIGRGRARNPLLLRVLNACKLTDSLIAVGAHITRAMMEIFADLPPDHPLVVEFSFLASDETAEYADALHRFTDRGIRGLRPDDRERLLAAAFDYIEARHRLNLLDDALCERILAARHQLHAEIAKTPATWDLEPYDPTELCHNALLRDNLLFGRINPGIANARTRIVQMVNDVVRDLDLRPAISALGLNYEVGPGGRMLTQRQRTGANIARCTVKNPDILILDGALVELPAADADAMLRRLCALFADRCLIFVTSAPDAAAMLDTVVTCTGSAGVTVASAPQSQHAQAVVPAVTPAVTADIAHESAR